jgi:fructokinase
MPHMQAFFARHDVDALGVAGFGPLDLSRTSPTYGHITSTPKLAWQNYPLLHELSGGLPSAIDTDVNAAVLAEIRLGAAVGLQSAAYVTVGTGIGAGICVEGQLVHGLMHPEVGHMLLRPHPKDPNPKGVCPYHDGCLEGLASGPAIGARIKGDARDLAEDDPTFDIEACYLAQMCVNLILTVSPQRIILGGGVMKRKALFNKVRNETMILLNGYVRHAAILERIHEYIVPPKLFPVSGLIGAYLLGLRAYEEEGRASGRTRES